MASIAPTIPTPTNKTLRAEQLNELSFKQMDDNLSLITRVHGASNTLNIPFINIFNDMHPDTSIFDQTIPFAVVNIEGTVTEIATNSSSTNVLTEVPRRSFSLTEGTNGITVAEILKKGATAPDQNTDILLVRGESISINPTQRGALGAYDFNIGITWLQDPQGIIFNPILSFMVAG